MYMRFKWFVLVCLICLPVVSFAAADLPDTATLRKWIQAMKAAPRGPFFRLRWFCKDGTLLPPNSSCREHGGGVQHGEWNAHTKRLRAGGYAIANILAELIFQEPGGQSVDASMYKQILLEQFLIAIDNGWIFRQAHTYRGALQAEDESEGARRLLLSLSTRTEGLSNGFLPLRTGVRLLPHGMENSAVVAVRQKSAALSQKDPAFMPLRNKIHVKPESADASRVRTYANRVPDAALKSEYEELARYIDKVYTSPAPSKLLNALARQLAKSQPKLAQTVRNGAAALEVRTNAGQRFQVTANLLVALREALPHIPHAQRRLAVLDAHVVLEDEHFAAATMLRQQLAQGTRQQRLAWLRTSADAAYGVGLMSPREWRALRQSLTRLAGDTVPLQTYKTELDYLTRVPGWGNQWLHFHFGSIVQRWTEIEPRAALFMQDQLRGSPLFFYAKLLDGLLRDANRLAGVQHHLFGAGVGTGLRNLNPGLARGVLRMAPEAGGAFDPQGIYILPATTSALPPVAGILTAGEGNPLSHVQLLARNLGIPNVGVDAALIPRLTARLGTRIVLAVSPAGTIQLNEDRGQWKTIFRQAAQQPHTLIRPDLQKLDLTYRALTPTRQLRASDSGRIVGPKAAKLGELGHAYPEAVAAGLTIPFGIFRSLLAQPMQGDGEDVFDWMVKQYAHLRTLPKDSLAYRDATETFRQRLQQWALQAQPGDAFWQRLKMAMAQVFGADGTYGVFVRSDTNVEDLPGFTGAGLNLTVPHVVGFEHVMQAISRVWASPFSQRAYAWRQAYMDRPQHVYPAVLLMRSVPVDKSGVLVTLDIDTGDPGWLSVAVNEGVGGAVDGQAAESLRIHLYTGEIRLLAQATTPTRRILLPQGGIAQVPVSGADRVLEAHEIAQLITLGRELPGRFPGLKDAKGNPAPADIEFGFLDGKLKLFQIRPFLESIQARGNHFLRQLDQGIQVRMTTTAVTMSSIPTGITP